MPAQPVPSIASGILNRPPGHLLLVAFAFKGDRSPAATRPAMEALREIARRELQSDLDLLDPTSPKDQPSAETGELGFIDGYNRAHLTITLGISSAGFSALGVAPDNQPKDLIPIPWGLLGDQAPAHDADDFILQICSDNVYINEHVARRVQEELGDHLDVVWAVSGVQRYTTRSGTTSRREGRALIGFLDGTSNLHPRNVEEDRRLVLVNPDPLAISSYPQLPPTQPGGGGPYPGTGPIFPSDLRPPPSREPSWTLNGTYMVVRASAQDISRWDALPLGQQEQVIGRFKFSGASLDLVDDPGQLEVQPGFVANQADTRVALASHVRKVNPQRSPEDQDRRFFRRGYALVQPSAAGLDRGLVFICFGRTISTQFEFAVRAWMNNENFPSPGTGKDMLQAFGTTILAGGYYFVPALARRTQPWSWILPEVAS